MSHLCPVITHCTLHWTWVHEIIANSCPQLGCYCYLSDFHSPLAAEFFIPFYFASFIHRERSRRRNSSWCPPARLKFWTVQQIVSQFRMSVTARLLERPAEFRALITQKRWATLRIQQFCTVVVVVVVRRSRGGMRLRYISIECTNGMAAARKFLIAVWLMPNCRADVRMWSEARRLFRNIITHY